MAAISKEIREMSLQPWFPIMMRELGYEPIKHGRWIKNPPTEAWEYHCSLCGTQEDYKENYCRNCGAKMDGGENESSR